jgi:geranylgeranyl diphosphate synthase type II
VTRWRLPRADANGPVSTGAGPAILREYGEATRAAMESYFATQPPADYLHELLTDYPRRGGKMMRSSICIAHARAFGGSLEDAVLSAAAIEMIHNALLIHDDIEDGSEVRRGKPTLHAIHGVPLALNAGDMLMMLGLRPLMDNVHRLGARRALAVLRETERMARETAEGQAMELGWRDHNRVDVSEADYLAMVLKKTAWMATIYPARVGALIGSNHAADPAALVRFGFFLGAAFQIQDDLLNLVADERHGKEANGDLFEAKRTLILIHAHRSCSGADRKRLARLLSLPRARRSGEEVAWLRALVERQGSIDHARAVAQGLAGAASYEFTRAYAGLPDSRDKQFIGDLVSWVLHRET